MAEKKASKVVIITGCSSGIGLATAVILAKDHKVYASMRDLKKADALKKAAAEKNVNVELLQLDVSSQKSVSEAIDAVIKAEGHIDVLVNNAGFGYVRSIETAPMADIQEVMDVNFYGVVRPMQAVLPHMRKARKGHIINVTSVGGLIGQPFNEFYCAAKFAVEGLSEGAAPLLLEFGINVSLIEPGPVKTEFVGRVKNDLKEAGPAKDDDEYAPYLKAYAEASGKRFDAAQSGEDIGLVIKKCIEDEKPHLRYLTSDFVKAFVGNKMKDLDGDATLGMLRKLMFGK